ncbi:MAG: SRPBCC domain-containing protein [Betaproteobacteria bacterium]|nr:SRPBCC domain-containing protein [Betaproteobacteria bacterium]
MATSKTETRPSLAITRQFNAAPAKIWRAITEPESLKQWMGPTEDFKTPVAEADLRVGGRYRVVMHAPGGEVHEVSGVYREVVPNRKLVYTWAWKSTPELESLATIELRATSNGTEFSLKHEQFADEGARDHHNQGWNGCLARLEKAVS